MYKCKLLIKQNYLGFLWGLIIAVFISLLFFLGSFDRLEKLSYDWRMRNNTWKKFTDIPEISIIGVTDEDIKQFGGWPLSRSIYAEAVNYLRKDGAGVIAFDMFFDIPDKEKPENDKALSDAAKKAGMVIFSTWSPGASYFKTAPLQGIYKGRMSENIEIISDSAKRIGHLNVIYDNDGVLRRTPALVASTSSKKTFAPLALATFLAYKGVEQGFAFNPGNSLRIGELNIPLDSKSCIPINYIDFEEQIYIYQSINPEWLEKIGYEKPIRLYSFSDLFPHKRKKELPVNQFKDNIVLIGITALGSEKDVHVTPFGRKFGIFVQANLIYNLLTGTCIKIPGAISTVLIFAGLSTIIGIVIFRLRIRGSTYLLLAGGILLIIVISAIIAFAGLFLFQRFNIMIYMIPVFFIFFINILACFAINLSAAGKESAMRDLGLNLLLEVGEITTSRDALNQYSLKYFQEDIMITSALSISSKPPTGFLEPIKRITNCEATALYVLDQKEKSFQYADSIGLNKNKDDLQKISRTITKWIQSDKKPVWIDNVGKHPDLSSLNTCINSVLAVPLIVKRQIIGILYLYNKFASKLSFFSGFTTEELRLISLFNHQITVAIENYRLYAKIHDIFLDYIKSVATALDARDAYTHGHSRRVAELSVEIAKELDFTEGELEFVELSATIHDIGKIGIREEILNKAGSLTDEEFTIIKSHTIEGAKILEPMSGLHVLMPGVRNHHERYDGKGYPDGLKGNEIHIIARIIAIADTYDAMTSDRVYRNSLSAEIAIKEIEKGSGSQFDPELVTVFLSTIKKYLKTKMNKQSADTHTFSQECEIQRTRSHM